ncbi:MAG: endonuclease VIII [Pseudomonadota bacterium]
MPEGPEIRRAADRLARVLEGQRLEAVEVDRVALPKVARRRRDLVGCEVDRLDTRGKALLTRLSNGLAIYSHNQLYGRWYVRPRGKLPQTNRSLRLALHTATHSALLYSASEVAVLTATAEAKHPFLSKLGPDLLDPALEWKALAERLAAPAFRRRSLAALYLDQGFLAGVGNYLRSEILFFARLSPWARPENLSSAALARLARTTLTIGARAYRTGGICNPRQRVAQLRQSFRADPEAFPRGEHEAIRFSVFDRDGEPCHSCGTIVERTTVSARRLYYCPTCQAEGAPSGA